MNGRLSMPRSRGGISGALLLLAGIWGALIPFVGPLFDWVIGPDTAFEMTQGRFWLSLVPGIAVIAGALILLGATNRLSGGFGAWLALAGGAWFVVGPTVSRLWNDGQTLAGTPMGGPSQQAFETLTYFEGLGALIVALAALALGRMTVRDHRDVEVHDASAREHREHAHDPDADPADRTDRGRFTSRDRVEEGERSAAAPSGTAERAPEDDALHRRDRPVL